MVKFQFKILENIEKHYIVCTYKHYIVYPYKIWLKLNFRIFEITFVSYFFISKTPEGYATLLEYVKVVIVFLHKNVLGFQLTVGNIIFANNMKLFPLIFEPVHLKYKMRVVQLIVAIILVFSGSVSNNRKSYRRQRNTCS